MLSSMAQSRNGGRTGKVTAGGNGQGPPKGGTDRDKEANGKGKRKGNHWWGALNSTGGSTKEEVLIRFGIYNIRNGRNGGQESALRGMSQANMDLGIFQETKSTPMSRTDTALSLWNRRANTAAGWPYSTDRHHFLWWRPSESTGRTS